MYLRSRLCPETRWGSLQRSPGSLAGGEGARCQERPPKISAFGLEFRPFWPQEPPSKNDMGSVSNQICCKGFRFAEKVEKHCLVQYWAIFFLKKIMLNGWFWVPEPLCVRATALVGQMTATRTRYTVYATYSGRGQERRTHTSRTTRSTYAGMELGPVGHFKTGQDL